MNHLFNEHDMFAWLDAHEKQIGQMVQAIPSNTLLSRPTDDVVTEIAGRLRMEVPVIHRDQAHADQKEAQVRAHSYADDYGLPGRPALVTGLSSPCMSPTREIATSSECAHRPSIVRRQLQT